MQFLKFKIAKIFVLFTAVLFCSVFAYTINTQTVKAWACGDALIDSRDSKSYSTVLIGTQCWMAQNLNVGTKIAGAGNQTNNSTLEKYCYSDNEANCTTYGGLYQWDEAMQYASSCNGTGAPPNDICSSPVQGICPTGWHMPSHYEFTTLERAVCTSGSCATDFPYDISTTSWRGTNEGTNLKSGGISGFNVLLSGYRVGGSFSDVGNAEYIWSSLDSSSSAWDRKIRSSTGTISRTTFDKVYGLSIRCLKNPNTAPTITSISASPTPVKGGSTITITPAGQTDADTNNLNLFCAEATAPTSATNICTEASTSYTSANYANMTCTYAAATDNTTHTVYCRTYDGSEYSNEVTTTFVTDSTAPTITITNPNTSPAQSKTITATTSDGTLTMSNTTGSTCDASLTFTTYASQTFTTESDNTTKVCYKAQDSVGNISYSLSNAIAGIDVTAPINVGISSIITDSSTQLTIIAQTATDSDSGLNATPYFFHETTGNSGSSSSYDYQASTTFIDTGLTPNTLYTYQVKAKDLAGNVSSYSTAVSAYTLAEAPTTLSATTNSNNAITLTTDTFTNSTQGSSGYYFTSSSGNNSGWIQTNTWQDSNLSCGTTYTYTVKYRNSNSQETSTISTTQATTTCAGGNLMLLNLIKAKAQEPQTPQPPTLPKTMTSEQKQILINEIKVKIAELVRQLLEMIKKGDGKLN